MMCKSDCVQVGLGGRRPVQVRIDDPAASIDGGIVPEIVGCFENDPSRIRGIVRFRPIGNYIEAFARNRAE